MKKNQLREKHFLLPVLFLLTLALSVSASFTVAKYTKTVDVGTISIEIEVDDEAVAVAEAEAGAGFEAEPEVWFEFGPEGEDNMPVLYRNFAHKYLFNMGVTGIIMDSYENVKYYPELQGVIALWDDPEIWVPVQQSAKDENTTDQDPLRGGIRMYWDKGSNTAYVIAEKNYPVCFPRDSSSMFEGCTILRYLDFGNIDTSDVTDMSSMFKDCRCLTSLNLSDFDTGKVTNMDSMFLFSEDLCVITLGANFRFAYNGSLELQESGTTFWYAEGSEAGELLYSYYVSDYQNNANASATTYVRISSNDSADSYDDSVSSRFSADINDLPADEVPLLEIDPADYYFYESTDSFFN